MAMLSRQQAVAELVDGAIGAWFDGRYACAITLAGAAETGMPKIDGSPSMFDALRGVVMKFGDCSERQAADLMNAGRNWLKHFSDDKPQAISCEHSWMYVLRAYYQFRSVYKEAEQTANMLKFQNKIAEHAQPIQEAVQASRVWMLHMVDAIAAISQPLRK